MLRPPAPGLQSQLNNTSIKLLSLLQLLASQSDFLQISQGSCHWEWEENQAKPRLPARFLGWETGKATSLSAPHHPPWRQWAEWQKLSEIIKGQIQFKREPVRTLPCRSDQEGSFLLSLWPSLLFVILLFIFLFPPSDSLN